MEFRLLIVYFTIGALITFATRDKIAKLDWEYGAEIAFNRFVLWPVVLVGKFILAITRGSME